MSKARGLADLGNAYSDGDLFDRNLIINGDSSVTVVDNADDGKVVVRVDGSYVAEFNDTHLVIPKGTTAERDSNAEIGSIRYNTTTDFFEVLTSSGWGALSSPPSVTDITPSNFSGEAGSTFTVNGALFDSGTTALFKGADGKEYAAATVTFVNSSQIIITNAKNLPVANEPFRVKVTNGSGLFAESIQGIDTGSVPSFTTAAGSLASTSRWDEAVSVAVQATDAENTISGYAVAEGNLPAGLTLDNATGAIAGTSTAQATTTYMFTIEATDSAGNTSTRQFSIQINNAAPVWNSPAEGITQEFKKFQAGSITLDATDPEGEAVSYTSDTLPAGLSLNGNVISGTPTVEANNSVAVTASDGFASSVRNFFINVIDPLALGNGELYAYRSSSENFSFAGYTLKSVDVSRADGSIYQGFVIESGQGGEKAWLLGHLTNAEKGGGGLPWSPFSGILGARYGGQAGHYSAWSQYSGARKVILLGDGGWAAYNWNEQLQNSPKNIVDQIGASGDSTTTVDFNPNGYTGKHGGQVYAIGGSSAVTADDFGNAAYVHLYGVSKSNDTDESVLAFTSQPSDVNSWNDRWRGSYQEGTIWSLWNDDFGNRSWPNLGQGGPGRPTTADDYGGPNYMVAYS